MKYITLKLYKKNELVKQKQKIIKIIKNLVLIKSDLLNNFWVKTMEISNYLSNKLLIKSRNYGMLILKKVWTSKK